jgi:hypothetical protein
VALGFYGWITATRTRQMDGTHQLVLPPLLALLLLLVLAPLPPHTITYYHLNSPRGART